MGTESDGQSPLRRPDLSSGRLCGSVPFSFLLGCFVFRQDKLWEEMEGKEKRGKKAQQAAKKNKKVRFFFLNHDAVWCFSCCTASFSLPLS